MKRATICLIAAAVVFAIAAPLAAQEAAPTAPPRVLQIYREEVKPGHGPAHAKTEAGWPRAFAKANWPTNYVAMTTVTGPGEAWFITGYESYEAWEKDSRNIEKNAGLQAELDQLSAQDGEHLSAGRSIALTYREDLSHRPGVSIPRMRYMSVTIVRIRPGHNEDYEEVRKIVKAAHEKAGVKDNHSVWQVSSGMPNGTFLVMTPMRSLAEADASPQVHGQNQAYRDAIGDEGRRKLRELTTAGTLSSETMVFAFSPKMSYVAKDWIAADPEFWAPKPAAKPAAKKAEAPAKP